MKKIIFVLVTLSLPCSVLADDASIVTELTAPGAPAIKIAAAIPRDVAFTVIIKDNSDFVEDLIANGMVTREYLSGMFEDLSGVEASDDGSIFDILYGETAFALYDRRDFGGKGNSFDPGLLIMAEMPSDLSSYQEFEAGLIDHIKAEAEETKTETYYSKTEIKIKDKKYRGSKYKQFRKKEKWESRYTDTDGKTHKSENESENEFYLGYNEAFLILSTEEKMYKKAVDTAQSGGGLAGSLPYLSCLSRINSDSYLVTYTPAESFDILSEMLEQEYRDNKEAPMGELLDDIDGMMTASSPGETGPTDEAVILLPDSGDNPFIRALGESKTLEAPAAVPTGYTAYFFYGCESIYQTIVEVIPGLASALKDSDTVDREIDEITGTIAYFQELSPGLLSSTGDEIAVMYRQYDLDVSYSEATPDDRELPERLETPVDEYIVAFNITDRDGFDRGIGFLDENTPESKIKQIEEAGATFYQFITDGETEAVFMVRDGWGYGALRMEALDYLLERLDDGTLSSDEKFVDGMSHLQTENNALVYLDYSAAFESKIDNDRLTSLIRPTMMSIVYDGEAIEVEGYPYNFWTYYFAPGFALGSMDIMSGAGTEE